MHLFIEMVPAGNGNVKSISAYIQWIRNTCHIWLYYKVYKCFFAVALSMANNRHFYVGLLKTWVLFLTTLSCTIENQYKTNNYNIDWGVCCALSNQAKSRCLLTNALVSVYEASLIEKLNAVIILSDCARLPLQYSGRVVLKVK